MSALGARYRGCVLTEQGQVEILGRKEAVDCHLAFVKKNQAGRKRPDDNPPTQETPAMPFTPVPAAPHAVDHYYVNAGYRFYFYSDHTKVFDGDGVVVSCYPPVMPAEPVADRPIPPFRVVPLSVPAFQLWPTQADVDAALSTADAEPPPSAGQKISSLMDQLWKESGRGTATECKEPITTISQAYDEYNRTGNVGESCVEHFMRGAGYRRVALGNGNGIAYVKKDAVAEVSLHTESASDSLRNAEPTQCEVDIKRLNGRLDRIEHILRNVQGYDL